MLIDEGAVMMVADKVSVYRQKDRENQNEGPAANTRTPLLYCSNSFGHLKEIQEKFQYKSPKGQWKRRAGNKGIEQTVDTNGVKGREGLDRLKRERGGLDESTDCMIAKVIPKKYKLDSNGIITQIFEVKETSREWSQPYK